MKMEIEGI